MDEIRQAYRDLARVWHPDRFIHDTRLCKLAEEKLKEINIAYEVLVRGLSSEQSDGQGDFTRARTSRSPSEEDKARADTRAESKNGPNRAQQDKQVFRYPTQARIKHGEPVFLSVILVFVVIILVFLYLLYPVHSPDKAGVVRMLVEAMPGDKSTTKTTGPKEPGMLTTSSATFRDTGVRITSPVLPQKTPSTLNGSREKKVTRKDEAPIDAVSMQMPVSVEKALILEHAKLDVNPTRDEERSGGTNNGGKAGQGQGAYWRHLGRTQHGEFFYDVNSVQHLAPTRFAFWIRIKILGDEKVRQMADLKKHSAQYASLTYLLGYNEIDTERMMWRRILVNYTDDRYISLHTWNVPEKWNYIPDHSVIEKALKEIKGAQ